MPTYTVIHALSSKKCLIDWSQKTMHSFESCEFPEFSDFCVRSFSFLEKIEKIVISPNYEKTIRRRYRVILVNLKLAELPRELPHKKCYRKQGDKL